MFKRSSKKDRQQLKKARQAKLRGERLEDRRLFAVSNLWFSGDKLVVRTDDASTHVDVRSVGSQIRVNEVGTSNYWDYARSLVGSLEFQGGSGHDRFINYVYDLAIRAFGGAGNDYLEGYGANDDLIGGDGNDTLRGYGGNDRLWGGNGNDYLSGGSGNDQLMGGHGRDRMYGGSGNDRMWGGTGNDYLSGSSGDDQLVGDSGNDTIYGGSGNDRAWGGSGNDVINGGSGNDRLQGDSGHDTLRGNSGDDILWGESGNDNLYGGSGEDQLIGGSGDDGLFGGRGRDRMWGQSGDDRFLIHKDQELDLGFVKIRYSEDTVHDYASNDAQVIFQDGDGKRFNFSGGRWSQFADGDFSDAEIERIDGALADLHHQVGNTRLLKQSNGDAVVFERLGAQTAGNFNAGGINSSGGKITLVDASFTGGDDSLSQVVFHEIGHNWDNENAEWGDWRAISGWRTFVWPWESGYTQSTDGTSWYRTGSTFARNYGRTNAKEDFATYFAKVMMDDSGRSYSGSGFNAQKETFMDDFFASLT